MSSTRETSIHWPDAHLFNSWDGPDPWAEPEPEIPDPKQWVKDFKISMPEHTCATKAQAEAERADKIRREKMERHFEERNRARLEIFHNIKLLESYTRKYSSPDESREYLTHEKHDPFQFHATDIFILGVKEKTWRDLILHVLGRFYKSNAFMFYESVIQYIDAISEIEPLEYQLRVMRMGKTAPITPRRHLFWLVFELACAYFDNYIRVTVRVYLKDTYETKKVQTSQFIRLLVNNKQPLRYEDIIPALDASDLGILRDTKAEIREFVSNSLIMRDELMLNAFCSALSCCACDIYEASKDAEPKPKPKAEPREDMICVMHNIRELKKWDEMGFGGPKIRDIIAELRVRATRDAQEFSLNHTPFDVEAVREKQDLLALEINAETDIARKEELINEWSAYGEYFFRTAHDDPIPKEIENDMRNRNAHAMFKLAGYVEAIYRR